MDNYLLHSSIVNANVQSVTSNLLSRVESVLLIHEVSATRFGYVAVGDPALVGRLRRGMIPRPRRRAKIEAALTKIEREGKI